MKTFFSEIKVWFFKWLLNEMNLLLTCLLIGKFSLWCFWLYQYIIYKVTSRTKGLIWRFKSFVTRIKLSGTHGKSSQWPTDQTLTTAFPHSYGISTAKRSLQHELISLKVMSEAMCTVYGKIRYNGRKRKETIWNNPVSKNWEKR